MRWRNSSPGSNSCDSPSPPRGDVPLPDGSSTTAGITPAAASPAPHQLEIAEQFVISVRTVEAHVGNGLRKLGLDSRTALRRQVIEHQRVTPHPAERSPISTRRLKVPAGIMGSGWSGPLSGVCCGAGYSISASTRLEFVPCGPSLRERSNAGGSVP